MDRRRSTEQRLHRLLDHLDDQIFRASADQRRAKTMVRVRIEGLIEIGEDLKNPVARITADGQGWRAEQGFRGHDDIVTVAGDLI